jgi:membrane protease YdiL (CAAX protease family)
MKAWAYAALVLLLLGFGYLAIFSIGAPFLLLGLILAVLFPWRDRRGLLATGTAVILGFVVGYVLVAPLSCTGSSISAAGGGLSEGTTVCTNLLGIPYEGGETYNPSLLPALLAGLVLAAIAGVATAWYLRHTARPPVDATA